MRTYGDPCGIARALDVIGERWALLVVRELLLGPKRFTDLRTGLPRIRPDVLAQRLRELERAGIVRRRTLAPPAASRVYELTRRGADLEPVVLELGRWGSSAPFPDTDAELGPDAAIVALKTMFDPAAASGVTGEYELRLDEQPFHARVAGSKLELDRGAAAAPEATIAGKPSALAAVLWHGRPLSAARRAGELEIEGGEPAARRFLGLFAVPEPEPPAQVPKRRTPRAAGRG